MTIRPVFNVECPYTGKILQVDTNKSPVFTIDQVPETLVFLDLFDDAKYVHPRLTESGKDWYEPMSEIIHQISKTKSRVSVIWISNESNDLFLSEQGDEFEEEPVTGWAVFSDEPLSLLEEIIREASD